MKFSIFTHWPCTVNVSCKNYDFLFYRRIQITSNHDDYYVARDENPMRVYLNVHGMLEQLRIKADVEKTRGPRVRFSCHF